ncbi:hypothetical protein B0H10DRAFT_1803203, partial [Mycena sp. CBHHK59/15]
LVQFSPQDEAVWITERQKFRAKAMGINFMDMCILLRGFPLHERYSYPAPNSTLDPKTTLFLSTTESKANLEYFSSFRTWYCNSDTGKASSEWLYNKILSYTTELASDEQKALITVEAFEHRWRQNSIIYPRLTPQNASDSDPLAIVGAHIDSANRKGPYLPAPGADDDGSGTATILEAYRALLVVNYIPVSPSEFHFYAGEEHGLLGSRAIVAHYEAVGKAVRGMQQFDMTAWHRAGAPEEIALSGSDYQILLTERYLPAPADHGSWTRAGCQACHPLESRFRMRNPRAKLTHWSAGDRMDVSDEFSFDHMLQFSKLAVAFAAELSSC